MPPKHWEMLCTDFYFTNFGDGKSSVSMSKDIFYESLPAFEDKTKVFQGISLVELFTICIDVH